MSGGIRPQRSAKSATAGYSTHPNYTGTGTAQADFIQWCDDNGVIAPALILYQWVRTNAPHKRYNNTSLAVMLKDDCIHVQDWTIGEQFTFFDSSHTAPAQHHADTVERKRVQQLAEEQRQAGYRQAAIEAATLWHESTEAPISGYFISKGLTDTHGARWHERLQCWLVLVTDIDGNVYTVQLIRNNGTKRYLKGSRTAGGMVVISSLKGASTVLPCEGFATGCTLREESDATVVCALTCNNLLAVCTAIRNKYPSVHLVVCADDDRQTAGNPGRTKAEAAARATAASVAYPPLCADCTCSDFNDAAMCKRVAP